MSLTLVVLGTNLLQQLPGGVFISIYLSNFFPEIFSDNYKQIYGKIENATT